MISIQKDKEVSKILRDIRVAMKYEKVREVIEKIEDEDFERESFIRDLASENIP